MQSDEAVKDQLRLGMAAHHQQPPLTAVRNIIYCILDDGRANQLVVKSSQEYYDFVRHSLGGFNRGSVSRAFGSELEAEAYCSAAGWDYFRKV